MVVPGIDKIAKHTAHTLSDVAGRHLNADGSPMTVKQLLGFKDNSKLAGVKDSQGSIVAFKNDLPDGAKVDLSGDLANTSGQQNILVEIYLH